jgi:hypothetical protein
VCERYDQEISSFGGIDDAVGKSGKPTAADVCRQGMPSMGVLFDQAESFNSLDQERITQTGSLGIVPANRVVQFRLNDA